MPAPVLDRRVGPKGRLYVSRIYSNIKAFAYPDHVRALSERRVVAPVHVRIKPINLCNHDCWYCAYRASQLQLGEAMDLRDKISEAKMFEIVDDLIAIGVEAVTFSGGGEPLLYKPLPEVIERLAAAGIRVAALTNGANLKGHMADAFARHGTWIRVSMDSWDDASCAENRNVKMGEFTRIVDNIRRFVGRRSRCVTGVSFIIGEKNCGHVHDVCRMLKDIGVNHVKLAAAVVSNDGVENDRYHRRFAAQAKAEIGKALSLRDEGFEVLDHYHVAGERFDKDYRICPYLQFLTVIGADCSVYTCQDKAYTAGGRLGSIKDCRFKDFWFSDENRGRLYAIDPSRDCRHHCVTHAKNVAIMDMLSLDPDHRSFV